MLPLIFIVFALLLADENPQALLHQAQSDLSAGNYASVTKRGMHAAALFRQRGDVANLVRSLTNVGLAQMYSGDYDPALQSFTEASDLARRIHDLEYEITSLNNIGTVLYFKGRYSEAMDRYRQAATQVESAPPAEWLASRRQLTVANTAILYQTLGQYDRSLNLYNGLLNTRQALSPREGAQVLANVGVLRRRLGDPQKALETYRAAQALYQKAEHRDGEIAVLNNIGIVQAMDLKDFKSAVATFSIALRLAQQTGNRPLAIHARLYRGEAYFRDGRLKEATADFDAAATEAGALGEQEEEWKADFGLARIAIRNKEAATGNELLNRAVRLIESMRANLGNSSLRSAFLADKRDVYDLLIEGTDNVSELFQYMEETRARNLKDRMQSGQTPSLAALLHSLPDDTAVLEYWMGDSSAAVLWISGGKTGIKRWTFTRGGRDAIAALPSILADPKRTDWSDSIRPLARNLLDDIAPLSDSRVRRLVIIPDGPLAQIPFEALPFSKGLLIERFTISYLPASTLASTRKPRRIRWFWQPSIEAFADPAPGTGNDPEPIASTVWQRLPQADREIRDIADALGGRAALYSGAAATKSPLAHDAGAPVLHFATHASADLENPDLSYIVMAPSSPSQRHDYLFLKEVGGLLLNSVDLVTLSACQTEVGKTVPGEGVESFSRAFLSSGVPSVVTSLWAVGDRPTAELMVRFYSRLAAGNSIADALRGAKLEFLHSNTAAHPAYWAAFILNGDGRSGLPYVVGRKWLLLPVALILSILFGIRKWAGTA